MAVKTKGGSAALKRQHEPGPPKLTRQGQGKSYAPSSVLNGMESVSSEYSEAWGYNEK
jgi:hypothetical protein